MRNIAFVEKIEDEKITISVVRKGSCGENCGMCHSCTAQKVLSRAFSDIDVKVGDTVEIESDTKSVLFTMFVVFLLPVVLPIVLYLSFVGINKILSYVAVGLGVIVAIVIMYLMSRSTLFIKKISPKIITVINKK